MPASRLAHLLRLAPIFLLLLGAAAVRADPPARVARVGEAEGTVSYSPAGDNEWTDLQRNRPLTRGDRLWADRHTRAELQVGSSIVRLDGQTRVEILALDDQSTQLSVTQGSVYVHVRSLPEGENFEIDTPNLAYRAAYPGDYRLDVDPAQGTTRVTILSGTGAVFGDSGQTAQLGGGQQITFRGRALAQVASQESPPEDAFDRWSMERNRREDQSIAARYVPREIVGYQQLDPYGQWRRHATYGAIWFPQALPAKWAPYRDGHWESIAPWGWTWIDDAPWGFAPFHYGRWVLVDDRWAWVPGRQSVQPVYAPALVAFVGGSTTELAWFPLAPGEPWQPAYAASPLYISNANRNIPLAPVTDYAYQRRPEALSAIAIAELDHGRPSASGWWRVATNLLTSAPIVSPPPLPQRMASARGTKPVRSAPPAVPVQPVAAVSLPTGRIAVPAQAPAERPRNTAAAAVAGNNASGAAPPVRLSASAPVPAARSGGSTLAQKPAATHPVQRSIAPPRPPRPPEVARVAPVMRTTSRPVAGTRAREQHASRERARHEQAHARAEQAQRAQVARRERAEGARRQAQTRREEQLRLAQAHREQRLRQQARARADEQLRRDMHASHVEQARRVAAREAQALREQRLQREESTRRVVQERDALPPPPPQSPPAWEQRSRQRARPDLRQEAPARAPDVWQRGFPILNPGPTS